MKTLVALLILLGGTLAHASDIYDETFARCSQVHGASAIWQGFSFKTARDSASESLKVVTFDPYAIATLIEDKGLSPKLAAALGSPDFHRALRDCYPGRPGLQRTYIAAMILSDLGGKLAVAAVTAVAGFAASKVLGAVVSAYPILRYTVISIGVSASLYRGYFWWRSINAPATPQDVARSQGVVEQIRQQSARQDDSIEAKIREKIVSLRQQAAQPGADREQIARHLARLHSDLDEIESFNPKKGVS